MPIRDLIKKEVNNILSRLTEHGYDAQIVGGAVRDLLLNRSPKDYDIATSATPEEVRAVFGRKRARIIGKRFRLVHVYSGHECYEISTYRREPTAEERKGRGNDSGLMIWRDNEFGNIKQDAFRRDFTVNALYYDSVKGEGLIDYVDGNNDIQNKIVRAIGDPEQRIHEDPVRLLRALKLVAQYDFTLEKELEKVVIKFAHLIDMASRARIFEELLKILANSYSHNTISQFHKYGILEHYLPNLEAIWTGPTGEFTRKMLSVRDKKIASGQYSTSKCLALATLCYATIAQELSDNSNEFIWEYRGGIETTCRNSVQDFFSPCPVSKFFSARVREIILLIPRFFYSIKPNKLTKHPEYKYGKALYSIIAEAMELPQEEIDKWPAAPEPVHHEHHKKNRRKRRRRKRSH